MLGTKRGWVPRGSTISPRSPQSYHKFSKQPFNQSLTRSRQNTKQIEQFEPQRTYSHSSSQFGGSSNPANSQWWDYVWLVFGLGLTSWTASAFCAENDKEKQILETADKLYQENKKQELYDLLNNHYTKNEGNVSPSLLWRLSRASYDMAAVHQKNNNQEERKRLIFLAHELAKKALEAATAFPPSPQELSACHKWVGITFSGIGEFLGIKNKILNAFLVRQHFDSAVKFNPKDATAHHLIGLWCFTLAEMSWMERKVAATVFASPPESNFQEALSHFLKAEEVDAGFYKKNALMVAKSYLKLNQKDQSQIWLKKTLELPINNLDDETAHQEALKLSQ
eukprot:TRINITY_DN8003_c0_g1_i1.p1 TRINITY_DN8003_c0_g1~~TRINITY_DN8003_c0_g1_i1.p1  ORF type:complete len:351 (-),score=93.88 TRINITY_DN8003_c0_g1_i1:86-1099(-)